MLHVHSVQWNAGMGNTDTLHPNSCFCSFLLLLLIAVAYYVLYPQLQSHRRRYKCCRQRIWHLYTGIQLPSLSNGICIPGQIPPKGPKDLKKSPKPPQKFSSCAHHEGTREGTQARLEITYKQQTSYNNCGF